MMQEWLYNRIPSVLLLCFLMISSIDAMDENATLRSLFERSNVNGTFILYNLKDKTIVGHNKLRSEKRYVPASTFKIANSLIGLSTGAVKSVDDPIPYTGPQNPFIAAWKNDMGLRRAIILSNVPIYQELARRIGSIQMEKYLDIFNYGNRIIGNTIDRFWLDGPLKISAYEQVMFLKKLVQESLPLPKNVQKDVKEILFIEQGKDYRLYGKTGWANIPDESIGWFVGWLEKSDDIYVFAFNMDMTDIAEAPKRIDLTKACLASLGLLNN